MANIDRLPDWAKDVVLASFRGSVAYGTVTEQTEDIDLFFITRQPKEHYLGLGYNKYQDAQKTWNITDGLNADVQIYDIRKFVHLLRKGNPNVHEYLWLDAYTESSPAGELLVEHRHEFLSDRVVRAICGFSDSLIGRMDEHRSGLGQKRRTIMEEHGYDLKDASHGYRLLCVLIHLCKEHEILVRVGEDDQRIVVGLKNGAYSQREAIDLLTQKQEEAYAIKENHDLPEDVDFQFINEILIRCINNDF